jgi:hypothetical protein
MGGDESIEPDYPRVVALLAGPGTDRLDPHSERANVSDLDLETVVSASGADPAGTWF